MSFTKKNVTELFCAKIFKLKVNSVQKACAKWFAVHISFLDEKLKTMSLMIFASCDLPDFKFKYLNQKALAQVSCIELTIHFFSYISAEIGGGRFAPRFRRPWTVLIAYDCSCKKIWKIWCLLQSEMIAKALQCAEKTLIVLNEVERSNTLETVYF